MAFPLAFAGVPLYIHAPDFYAGNFNISLATLGLSLLFLRIIDAVQDPLIGYISDKYHSKRKAIFITGIFLLAAGFYALFNPSEVNTIVWFCASVFIATTGYSIISINLNALGGVWSSDKNEKTRISSFREFFGLVGLILAAALPSILLSDNSSLKAFSIYSSIMIVVLLVTSLIFISLWLSKTALSNQSSEKISFSKFKTSISEKKKFFLVYFISMLASSIPAVLIIFYVRDVLGHEQHLGLFLVAYFLAGAVSMPLWNYLSKRFGKLNSWLVSMMLAVATFIWAYFLGNNDFYPYLLVCILSGLAFGAELSLPPSILADKVNNTTYTTDYSVLAFLSKAALALATGFALATA
jgi:GPH family glycoside/pentoside/hexuronide:cation symporter